MPCLCDGYTESDKRQSEDSATIRILEKEKSNLEAALCAALTYITHAPSDVSYVNFICHTDWNEVGITSRQVDTWWNNHQKKDLLRKERETRESERKAEQARKRLAAEIRRNAALSKLTEEEKNILGLK